LWDWFGDFNWYWQLLIMFATGFGAFCALGGAITAHEREHGAIGLIILVLGICCAAVCLHAAWGLLRDFVVAISTVHPTDWPWYWQAVAFVLLAIGAIACAAAAQIGWSEHEGRGIVLYGIALLAICPCAVMFWEFLVGAFHFVLPRIRLAALAISAACALFGSLITRSVDRSGYSISRSAEWRYLNSNRKHHDATNREVWEHRHGSKSWEKRISRQRVGWGACAIIVGTFVAATSNSTWVLSTIFVNAVASLLVTTAVMAMAKR
jgi:hypothetical protein